MSADASHSERQFEDWPVLPEGVEGVLLFRATAEPPEPEDCFVCGEPIGPRERCWGIPGGGVAHGGCYEPEDG